MKKITLFTLLSFILLSSIYINIGFLPSAYSKTTLDSGGYFQEIKFIRYSNDNIAYQDTSNGNLDIYYYQMPLQLIDDAKTNPNLRIYDREGISYGLLVNPAKNDQMFNPFSIKEIRYALNFLIDRGMIVNDLLKGFGTPIVEPYGSTSPEYPNIVDVIEPLKIHYDPNFAIKSISNSMQKIGSKLDATGKWTLNGRPVIVKILIRNDDISRKTFGDIVASEIEKAGFSVSKEYGDLIKANSVVYASNPADLEWNIYVESFLNGAFSRYSPGTVGQMYAPWEGSMPGSQNPAYWKYSNSTIDNVTQKLEFSKYTSKEERDDLLKKGELMGIQEAVRLFFARTHDPYISSIKINGLVNDYSAGIANRLSIINAHRDGLPNSTLNIGVKQVYQGAWNNVDGCKDVYCRQIYSLISDDPIFLDPYTGDPVPYRNNWTGVDSNGPNNKIAVPSDTIVWNTYGQSWKSNSNTNTSTANFTGDASGNTTALSKITIKPLFSNWHNGIPVDKFDLMYSFYFPYQWSINTGKNDTTFDAEYSSLTLPTLPLIKGIKFYQNNTFDYYVDMWHYDKRQVPSYGTLWSTEPWEITAATERLVSENKLTYSKTDSNVKHVDQLSLVLPTHSELIKQELLKMKQEKYIPNALKGLVTLDYVLKRYDASIEWINQHHHSVIGNGPYYLDTFNPSGGIVILKKFTDDKYPYKVGYFSKYEKPPAVNIDEIDIPKFIKIGDNFTFDILFKRGNIEDKTKSLNETIHYFVTDRNNKIVTEGAIDQTKSYDGKGEDSDPFHKFASINTLSSTYFRIQNIQGVNLDKITVGLDSAITQKLLLGPSKLKLIITSGDSPRPVIYESTLITIP